MLKLLDLVLSNAQLYCRDSNQKNLQSRKRNSKGLGHQPKRLCFEVVSVSKWAALSSPSNSLQNFLDLHELLSSTPKLHVL